MPIFMPFRALRPAPGRAGEVIAPPYDVLSSAEAKARADGRPNSFLHVSKSEIDLPDGTDPYDAAVYAKASENLERMKRDGVLIQDESPKLYVYRLTREGRVQTGVAGAASLADYAANRIRKHEFTTPVKEDDRVRQIEALSAQTGPVMLAYRATPAIDDILAEASSGAPDMDETADDGVRHEMWTMHDPGMIGRLVVAFEMQPALYIADGHHRSAAALRVSQARGGPKEDEGFLAVAFPHDQMRILDYNRLVKDLNGRSQGEFLTEIGFAFDMFPSETPVHPRALDEYGMYLAGGWFRLMLKSGIRPDNDPVGRLAVSLLDRNLIAPILGITDPRRDKRIDFVGGARGLPELEKRVNQGDAAVAFALFPTSMDELMNVAEAGEVMPPKSTWFEPKLADGLVSLVLE